MTVGPWPERRQRHIVRLPAAIVGSDGREVATMVTNLSLEGCCLADSFGIGQLVTVTMPRLGTFEGEVRWSNGLSAGVRFHHSGLPRGE